MSYTGINLDDTLITPIKTMVEAGAVNISSGVLVVASLIAILDLIFSIFTGWSDNIGDLIIKLIQKLIRYSFTFMLINIYQELLDMSYKVFTKIGNSFGNGLGDPITVQNAYKTLEKEIMSFLQTGLEFESFWSLVYLVLFIIAFIFLIFVMFALVMAILQFYLVGNLAIIYLAFMPSETFSEIGKKTISAIIGAGTSLMVTVALVSMGTKILIDDFPFPTDIGVQNNEPQTFLTWISVFAVISFLIVSQDSITSMILTGNGGVTGGMLGSFVGGIVTTGGAAVGAIGKTITGIGKGAGGLAGGVKGTLDGLKKSRENGQGLADSIKTVSQSAKEGLKKGAKVGGEVTGIAGKSGTFVADVSSVTGNLIKDLSQGKIVDSVKDVKEATKIVGRTIKEGAIIGGEIVGDLMNNSKTNKQNASSNNASGSANSNSTQSTSTSSNTKTAKEESTRNRETTTNTQSTTNSGSSVNANKTADTTKTTEELSKKNTSSTQESNKETISNSKEKEKSWENS